jgi:hypothetical protein
MIVKNLSKAKLIYDCRKISGANLVSDGKKKSVEQI